MNDKERKMQFRIFMYVCLAMFVAGCAGSPYQTSRMDSEELAEISDKQLMQALENHLSRNDAILDEAFNRGWLLEDDIPLIKKEKIAIGMSERALILALGQPYRVNEKIGSWGIHKEYIYGGYGPDSKITHVYLENGQVARWEEKGGPKDETEVIDSEGGRDG
jgi:hypothetical protein